MAFSMSAAPTVSGFATARTNSLPKHVTQRVSMVKCAPKPRSLSLSSKRTQSLVVRAVAADADTARPRPGEKKGFVEEMRFVAMKLHTKEQAPKEGEAKVDQEQQKSMMQWVPTREGYLQFLAESKVMYEALETIMAEASHDSYKNFQNTGLERSAALAADIAWFKEAYGMEPAELSAEGPGSEYVKLLKDLAVANPPAFICHFYNVYFAHSAGGRMIGTKMSESLLDRHELEFYKYNGADMKELLGHVKEKLNAVADSWTREEKDVCLEETSNSFKYSGAILRTIFGA